MATAGASIDHRVVYREQVTRFLRHFADPPADPLYLLLTEDWELLS